MSDCARRVGCTQLVSRLKLLLKTPGQLQKVPGRQQEGGARQLQTTDLLRLYATLLWPEAGTPGVATGAPWVLLVAMALVLAGCAQPPSDVETISSRSMPGQEPAAEAAPTETQGSLIVWVRDDEGVPVSAAHVQLAETDYSAFSDTAGRVTFNGLGASHFVVLGSKPGYHSLQEGGIVVEVLAGATAEVQITMAAVAVVTAEDSYSVTTPVGGFIACATYVQMIGSFSYCGEGVPFMGMWLGQDPNDNTTHPWDVDNAHVRGVVIELSWTPASSLGDALRMSAYGYRDCQNNNFQGVVCSAYERIGNVAGPSPLVQMRVIEGQERNITGAFLQPTFPHPMLVTVVANSQGTHNVIIDQRYELWISEFYGSEPLSDFTALA